MSFAEIDLHERKIEVIKQDLRDFSNQIFKLYTAKEPLILDWAHHLEALTLLGKRKEPVNTISWEVGKELNELMADDKDHSRWVQKVFDKAGLNKYKRSGGYDVSEKDRTEQIRLESGSIPQEYQKPMEIMTDGELVSAVEFFDKQEAEERRRAKMFGEKKTEFVKAAEERNIELPVHIPIGTKKDTPRETTLSDELGYLAKDILEVQKKVIEFPPSDEDAGVWKEAIHDFRQIFKGHIDEKWTKSIPEWFSVQVTNIIHGKHAAAVKHGTVLPDGTKRNLTREQVGDNAEEILTLARKLVDSFSGLAALVAWHIKYAEPKIAERKRELNPVLSDKA